MPSSCVDAGGTPAYPVLFVLGDDAGDHVGGEAAVDFASSSSAYMSADNFDNGGLITDTKRGGEKKPLVL